MQANTMLCLDMSKCQFDMENFNVIRTNYHSSVKVRVLLPWGGGCRGEGGKHMLSLMSLLPGWDTSGHKKILSPLIGQKFKMANGKQSSDWTIIQNGGWACDWTRSQDGRGKSNHLTGQ